MARQFSPASEASINLSLIIDCLPSMIYRRKNNPEWSMEYVSNGSIKVTGYSSEEFLEPGKVDYKELIHNDDKEHVLCEMETALYQHNSFTVTYRIMDKQKKTKWIFERGHGIFSEKDTLIAVEGSISDITEEKRVQRKYDETVSLLNSALNSIGEGIIVVNLKGRITFINKKFTKMWNISEQKNDGMLIEELVNYISLQLKDENTFIESVKSLSNEHYLDRKEILELKDGRFFELFSRPQILNGKAVGRVWSFLDITERVLFDDLLSKERDLLQALMDNIPDTIYFKDTGSRFIRINKAEARLLGAKSPGEAIGKTDFDYFGPEHAAEAYADEQRIMKSNEGIIAKVEKLRYGGNEYRWFTATKVPFLDKSGNVIGIVGISRDITSSKLAEEKLSKYSQELNELNASKDKLFSIIAHDLRSPFSPMLGISEMLAMNLDTFSHEEIKEYSLELNKALKNQFNLLEDLLNWSRMETGKISIYPVEINLISSVDRVVKLLSINARNKNISLLNSVFKTQTVFADLDMLHSILQNLISNAIKFTRPGGVINITSQELEGFIELTIEDNGIGIKEENLKNIFGLNCFSTYGTNKEKGTGLGLLICKEMVEKNGGTISVSSKYGRGSRFVFTLPKADTAVPYN